MANIQNGFLGGLNSVVNAVQNNALNQQYAAGLQAQQQYANAQFAQSNYSQTYQSYVQSNHRVSGMSMGIDWDDGLLKKNTHCPWCGDIDFMDDDKMKSHFLKHAEDDGPDGTVPELWKSLKMAI